MDKGVGGLENWIIFMDVICISSLKENPAFENRHTIGTDFDINREYLTEAR